MPVHPYSHYKLFTLLDEEEEDKKKRYHLILSSTAFIPLLRRKRAYASSLITLPGLLEVLVPILVFGAFSILSLIIFFSSGNKTPTSVSIDPASASIAPASAATVSIVPMSITQQQSYTISAVTANPNGAANQVYAHIITTTTAPVSKTVNATGQVPGTSATGTVYVESHDSNTLTINAGQRFTNLNTPPAIDIQFDMTVTVQPFQTQPRVPVHVVQAGTIGNISPCCSQPSFQNFCDPNVSNCGQGYDMFSDSTFTGGTDPQTVVQQSDIDNAVNALVSMHTPDARQALQGQVKANEQLIVTQPCNHQSIADQPAGAQVSQVLVTVSFTCSGEVYDRDSALKLAQSLLQQQQRQLHPTYELVGTITATMQTAPLTDPNSGTITLTIQASGTWVAHFDTQWEQALAQAIAGKTKAEAQAILNNQPEIQMASIQLQGGNSDRLPTDPTRIIFTVLPT